MQNASALAMSPEQVLITVDEVASLLRISRGKAYSMAATGEIPGVVRFGRSVRVRRRQLLEWLERQA